MIKIGDRVRLTSEFLRNTGQYTGPEPFKVWTVKYVIPISDRTTFIYVDERNNANFMDYTPDELADNPWLAYRGINAANLEIVR